MPFKKKKPVAVIEEVNEQIPGYEDGVGEILPDPTPEPDELADHVLERLSALEANVDKIQSSIGALLDRMQSFSKAASGVSRIWSFIVNNADQIPQDLRNDQQGLDLEKAEAYCTSIEKGNEGLERKDRRKILIPGVGISRRVEK